MAWAGRSVRAGARTSARRPWVLAAVSAFVLSGEAELSAGFLAWDLLQVLLAAVATRVLVGRLVQVRRRETGGDWPV